MSESAEPPLHRASKLFHSCLQANQLIIAALVQPGDRVVVMEPAYRQVTRSPNPRACCRAYAMSSPFVLSITVWRQLQLCCGSIKPQTLFPRHAYRLTVGLQVWGCALNAGAKIDSFGLLPDAGWRPDLEALERLATSNTRLIAITNPNNPVGTVLTPQVLML